MMTGINREEWLAALKDANEAPLPHSDAVTIREFAELTGYGIAHATRKMRQLVLMEKATPTTKLMRRSNGAVITVPAYRLKD